MNFIIIHGVYSNPEANWFPWIKKELEKRGFEVIVPKFPTPLDQTRESWLRIISKYKGKIKNETVLIGHSLGAAFILDYLEQTDKKIKAAFLVAGYHKLINNEFDELNKTFVGRKFNWSKIKQNCRKFFVIASDNDPYIPLEINEELAGILDAELNVIHNGGHLNKKAGYEKFLELLELVTKFINIPK
ncbi:serine hydrolase family protein [Candidatus Woesearchaeota archaeon]|nr:serine hydrolase family protein [Candidatus Woesearchaeota archaeon]